RRAYRRKPQAQCKQRETGRERALATVAVDPTSERYQRKGGGQRGQRERKRELLWRQLQHVAPVKGDDWYQHRDAERQTKHDKKEDGELGVEADTPGGHGLLKVCRRPGLFRKYRDHQEGECDQAEAEPERKGERAAQPNQQT